MHVSGGYRSCKRSRRGLEKRCAGGGAKVAVRSAPVPVKAKPKGGCLSNEFEHSMTVAQKDVPKWPLGKWKQRPTPAYNSALENFEPQRSKRSSLFLLSIVPHTWAAAKKEKTRTAQFEAGLRQPRGPDHAGGAAGEDGQPRGL